MIIISEKNGVISHVSIKNLVKGTKGKFNILEMSRLDNGDYSVQSYGISQVSSDASEKDEVVGIDNIVPANELRNYLSGYNLRDRQLYKCENGKKSKISEKEFDRLISTNFAIYEFQHQQHQKIDEPQMNTRWNHMQERRSKNDAITK